MPKYKEGPYVEPTAEDEGVAYKTALTAFSEAHEGARRLVRWYLARALYERTGREEWAKEAEAERRLWELDALIRRRGP